MLEIVIGGAPLGQSRPRVTRFGTYSPQKKIKQSVELQMLAQLSKIPHFVPLSCPLRAEFEFHMPIPKSWSKRKKENAPATPHLVKPDVSNMIKFYEDIGNGILYADDKQIVEVSAEKFYSDEPKAIMRLFEACESPAHLAQQES